MLTVIMTTLICSFRRFLMQLLPIILLLFLSLFSFPTEQERPFSLHRSDRHRVLRQTSVDHVVPGINYYVNPDFNREFGANRNRLYAVSS
jgi:hypothetical protein